MGTTFRIVLYAKDDASAQAAFRASFQRIEELNNILSDYLKESELSRLSRSGGTGGKVRVSADLWTVLQAANQYAEATGGAFDVTVGPYARMWKLARRKKEVPSPDRIRGFHGSVGFHHVKLFSKTRSICLGSPNMLLDLGGIAKGYAADQVLQVLHDLGIHSALVDAGGDIVLGAPPPGKEGWSIAVGGRRHPDLPLLKLSRCAVATSGDLEQFVEIDGKRYSHIVDPRTGIGLTNQVQASIIARTGMEADALASAVCVLGTKDGKTLLKDYPNTRGFLLHRKENQTLIEIIQSK